MELEIKGCDALLAHRVGNEVKEAYRYICRVIIQ